MTCNASLLISSLQWKDQVIFTVKQINNEEVKGDATENWKALSSGVELFDAVSTGLV